MEKTKVNNKEVKNQSNQPSYGDKPWQTPEYGQKDAQKDSDDDSCGCGSDKDNKKTTKRH